MITRLLLDWNNEMNHLKETLWDIGDKGDSFQYNILSAEALRLSMCINELQTVLIDGLSND